jgi:hypothetical protein
MATAATFRALGKEFDIVNVMATLFKSKTPVTPEKLRSYVMNATVHSALKKINDLAQLNAQTINAIFRVFETHALSKRRFSLNEYLNEITKLAMSQTVHEVITMFATEGSDVELAFTMLDSLVSSQEPAASMPASDGSSMPASDGSSMPASDGSSMPASTATSATTVSKPKIIRKPRPVASKASVASVAASAETVSMATALTLTSSALTSSNESALTSSNESVLTSANESALTSSKESALTSSKESALTSSKESALTSSKESALSSASTDTEISKGFKIHVKKDKLNKDKYDSSMLERVYNTEAKLLVVDIESCKHLIYPVAVDLPPSSTNQDLLTSVVNVLTQASEKNLKCHTTLHVYAVKAWSNTDRVTYINI